MARATLFLTEEDKLVSRLLETPTERKRRIARKPIDPAVAAAIRRLYAEDLDLSASDLIYHARLSVNAARGGRARAAKLSPARRRAIAWKASKAALAKRRAKEGQR